MSRAESGVATGPVFQKLGVTPDLLPVMAAEIKARLAYPLAWTPQVQDLAVWKAAGRARFWALTLQAPERTPFEACVLDEQDRGSYLARKLAFNLTADSRVSGLLLLPKGSGPFPAAILYHDHGSRFDIGKEKLIETWGDDPRLASSREWAGRYFSGRFPGDELAKRGYAVFAHDALGWSDRGTLTYEAQQALAANFANLGSSLAGLMALEDVRAAEFLASLPEVRRGQVAALGFSMGAFRAWQAAALTDAVDAALAANWMITAAGLMVPGSNHLRGGSAWQMTHPGLLRDLDYPDVASLAAPKPMLCYAGEQDPLFPLDAVKEAFGKMARVWDAWQAGDRFEGRIWPGAHVFEAAQQEHAFDWLDKQFGLKR